MTKLHYALRTISALEYKVRSRQNGRNVHAASNLLMALRAAKFKVERGQKVNISSLEQRVRSL